MEKLTGCAFLLKMMSYLKYIAIFGIKSRIVLKKNLIANPSINKFSENQARFYGDAATDFHNKEVSKAGSNYTCLAAILIYSIL